jgi:hypothetical protein
MLGRSEAPNPFGGRKPLSRGECSLGRWHWLNANYHPHITRSTTARGGSTGDPPDMTGSEIPPLAALGWSRELVNATAQQLNSDRQQLGLALFTKAAAWL